MAQDIRKLLQESADFKTGGMPPGHQQRFEAKLAKAFPHRKKQGSWLRIAASVAVLCGVGYLGYRVFQSPETTAAVVTQTEKSAPGTLTLGGISPDLRKVERYYVANINVALSELELSAENKPLIASYLDRLTELNDEYQKLNGELNEVGPNEQTVNALIGNLQLRLQLLYQLKEKLNELKQTNYENTLQQT